MTDHTCCCRHAGCACTKPPARSGRGGAWTALAVAALLGWGLLNGGQEHGDPHGEPVRRPSPGISASGGQ
ncbi:hypothetical protein Q3V23_30180 [Streptomyces sp. VNUA116]|uniref:hypothetical protein n=1 Tax=Streptomyces sp. VNUA116 TaxID=3062449 RepID=UPI002674BD60|nr:hypothetical protein [Streptomyces sp. VNUA116]WKU47984.1 hypothetical protein Q3V23_30180 [Streptomyces sp. VNUA116]